MASNYFLSYDLNGQRPTHAEMDKHLKALGGNVHRVLETVWYISHGGTLEQIFEYASQILSKNDRLLVIHANNARMRNLLVPNDAVVRSWPTDTKWPSVTTDGQSKAACDDVEYCDSHWSCSSWGISMNTGTACEALAKGCLLEIRYDGFTRDVEVHACGFTKDGNAIMRVWQVRGGSVHNEPVGWKLLRLDEALAFALLDEKAAAPRRGYKRGDKAMARVICEI